jgi:hypothetical protein
VPEIQALMQNEAMEKYPRDPAKQLIEEAGELCAEGETEEALYKLRSPRRRSRIRRSRIRLANSPSGFLGP